MGCFDVVEPNDLILLAGRDNGVVGYGAEYPFTGLQDLQLRTAMRASTFAKAVGQCPVALPRMAALRAGNDTLCRPAADVVEAMTERMVLLRFGDMGQTAAQSCYLDLYLCLRFHRNAVLGFIGIRASFACLRRFVSWRRAYAASYAHRLRFRRASWRRVVPAVSPPRSVRWYD